MEFLTYFIISHSIVGFLYNKLLLISADMWKLDQVAYFH